MAWRLARSLGQLFNDANAAAPKRNKRADGSIGDPAHASRVSDHNPDSRGIVHAIDITHDPANGLDSYALAERLRTSGDRRIKYIISNGKISNPSIAGGAWRRYSGSNAHKQHVHVSVNRTYEDDASHWNVGNVVYKFGQRLLEVGTKGPDVRELQTRLTAIGFNTGPVDGDYGPGTEKAVKAFQSAQKLVADGQAGPNTLSTLMKVVNFGAHYAGDIYALVEASARKDFGPLSDRIRNIAKNRVAEYENLLGREPGSIISDGDNGFMRMAHDVAEKGRPMGSSENEPGSVRWSLNNNALALSNALTVVEPVEASKEELEELAVHALEDRGISVNDDQRAIIRSAIDALFRTRKVSYA